jgi:prepilin-type N-terminal cleavage/methylation domain-containing protein
MPRHSLRPRSGVARWRERDRGDEGMTLIEVLLASTVLVVLLTMVAISMSVLNNISGAVSSQFQEYDQALPALAPIQALIRAEVEPAAPNGPGVPTPGFAQYGTTSLNFGMQFYSNIGTAYNNLTAAGTTAGPAKMVALELDQSGNPVTSSTSCTAKTPCRFQVRRYLPVVNSGISTCPVATDGSVGPCQYPSTYTLITNASDVVNNPSNTTGGVPNQPVFGYSLFDPNWPAGASSTGTGILLTAGEIQNNLITGLAASPYSYPTNTQTVTACAAPNASYPTTAIACPLDAVQSVSVELMVAAPGSGTNGTVDNQTVIYRYPPTGTGSNITYPYQFSSAVG